jgi:Spy/CpxP family protein refolding chaperone
MAGMTSSPAMILNLRQSLGLTDEQIDRLEALRDNVRSEVRQNMMQGMQTMRAAQELLEAESPDLTVYQERLREAANDMVLARTAMAQAAVEARALLTTEQRDQLALARRMFHEIRGGTANGMMGPGFMHDHGSPEAGAHHRR